MRGARPVRIAAFSGHSADRLTGLSEAAEWGGPGTGFLPADFIVGDLLAEATLAYLAKRDIGGQLGGGYLQGFVKQLQSSFNAVADKGIRIVTNAGGANPEGLAKAVKELAIKMLGEKRGSAIKVAWVSGDAVGRNLERWKTTGEAGEMRNMDTGIKLSEWDKQPSSANAYLGGFGIIEALEKGAQIVVCGRITDATLCLAPAAWWWSWKRQEFDQLAAAILVGHLIECGAQVTGGNFSGFLSIPKNITPAFPMAIIDKDGTAVITKVHPEHGGDVTVDTCTAQIVYEVQGPNYLNPDATVDLRSVQLEQISYEWDRIPGSSSNTSAPRSTAVRVSGIRGTAPPPTTKVGVNASAGFACEVSVFAVGLEIPEKFLHFQLQVRELLHRNGNSVEHLYGNEAAGNKNPNKIEGIRFECVGYNGPMTSASTALIGAASDSGSQLEQYYSDPLTQNACTAWFRVTAHAKTRDPVSRPKFAGIITGQAILPGFPGFVCQADGSKFDPAPFIEYFPTLIPHGVLKHEAHIPGVGTFKIPSQPVVSEPPKPFVSEEYVGGKSPRDFGATRRVPLGLVVHGRCGDKGGNANLGFWPVARKAGATDEVYEWLRALMTSDKMRELLGNEIVEVERRENLKVRMVRWEMDNLRAVCFIAKGLLGKGLSSNLRVDPLGKSVAEFVRARLVDVPIKFLEDVARQRAAGVYGVGISEKTVPDVEGGKRLLLEQVRIAKL